LPFNDRASGIFDHKRPVGQKNIAGRRCHHGMVMIDQ